MIADVRKLDRIEDNSVEEIMAIHLFEHFVYWEVTDILADWHKKLIPDGKLIIECPNILYAAHKLLEWASSNDSEGEPLIARPNSIPNPQHTMWVFYGDPSSKNPWNCHHWGYWPGHVMDLMKAVGFKDAYDEPAQFKLGPPRDFRVVGVK